MAFPSDTSKYHLKMFERYADDIFVIVKKGHVVALPEHLNGLYPTRLRSPWKKKHADNKRRCDKNRQPLLVAVLKKGVPKASREVSKLPFQPFNE
ncbi:hypothetical protein M514_20983 [Trichuris suis]|uniref:Reverse transcriptase domain-containing protein n=1 Tax=Trichuris suis TaxID=68888 RepID=A0A085NBJ3_9BILA|nr:hypothetical protein M514_20983 [Trichuris suis]